MNYVYFNYNELSSEMSPLALPNLLLATKHKRKINNNIINLIKNKNIYSSYALKYIIISVHKYIENKQFPHHTSY